MRWRYRCAHHDGGASVEARALTEAMDLGFRVCMWLQENVSSSPGKQQDVVETLAWGCLQWSGYLSTTSGGVQ